MLYAAILHLLRLLNSIPLFNYDYSIDEHLSYYNNATLETLVKVFWCKICERAFIGFIPME